VARTSCEGLQAGRRRRRVGLVREVQDDEQHEHGREVGRPTRSETRRRNPKSIPALSRFRWSRPIPGPIRAEASNCCRPATGMGSSCSTSPLDDHRTIKGHLVGSRMASEFSVGCWRVRSCAAGAAGPDRGDGGADHWESSSSTSSNSGCARRAEPTRLRERDLPLPSPQHL
jgi:hypothetical protein